LVIEEATLSWQKRVKLIAQAHNISTSFPLLVKKRPLSEELGWDEIYGVGDPRRKKIRYS